MTWYFLLLGRNWESSWTEFSSMRAPARFFLLLQRAKTRNNGTDTSAESAHLHLHIEVAFALLQLLVGAHLLEAENRGDAGWCVVIYHHVTIIEHAHCCSDAWSIVCFFNVLKRGHRPVISKYFILLLIRIFNIRASCQLIHWSISELLKIDLLFHTDKPLIVLRCEQLLNLVFEFVALHCLRRRHFHFRERDIHARIKCGALCNISYTDYELVGGLHWWTSTDEAVKDLSFEL